VKYKMNIDRDHICEEFIMYTDNYNSSDTKIKLKIDHTFRVAKMCEIIANSLELTREDVNLAWIIGMLHDIGRFEQVKRYNTFNDAKSIDHAHFGADLLFCEDLIDSFFDRGLSKKNLIPYDKTNEYMYILETAIRNHSAYRIDENLSERCKMFCDIIRDADKIDILKVNAELPIEEIYNVTTKELKESSITDEVLDSFYEEHAVLRKLKKTPVDNIIGHVSLVYELVFDISYKLVDEQGYIYKLMDFKSENEETELTMKSVRNHMSDYIRNKIS